MVQPSGCGWAQLPLLLCVCIFNTPVKHRNSDFSGFKVPPFSFRTQSGIFSEPWTDAVLPQVHRAAFPQGFLFDPLKWYLSFPIHSFKPCLLEPPKNGGVRGKLLPGVSCMSWWAWGHENETKCPAEHFPEPHQCSLSSDSLPMPCECLSWAYTNFKSFKMV